MKTFLSIAAALLLAGCTATTTFQSTQPDGVLAVKKSSLTAIPRSETFPTTSFGNYEFRIVEKGSEPFYGILPLKFNGGYLAADIIFFAPATFFNLREVFPHYEFDAARGIVKYRRKETDAWVEYRPLPAEAERARKFFEGS